MSFCPADKLLLLTATPCTNSPRALWPRLNLCEPGVAGEEQWWASKIVGPIEGRGTETMKRLARIVLDPLVARFVLRRVIRPDELPARYDDHRDACARPTRTTAD